MIKLATIIMYPLMRLANWLAGLTFILLLCGIADAVTIDADPDMVQRIQSVYDDTMAVLEEETGWNAIGRVTIYCPSGDHATYNYSVTMLGTAIIRERIDLRYDWQDWQLRHELGHAVMTSLYNFRHDYLPGIGEEDDSRELWESTTEGFALREGFASYCQVLMSGRRSDILAGITKYDPKVAGDVAAVLYSFDARFVFQWLSNRHPKTAAGLMIKHRRPIVWSRYRTAR